MSADPVRPASLPVPRWVESTPAAVGLIALATLAAYANSFAVPFLFDDVASIVENPTLRSLWPLSGPLTPPAEGGLTVSGRPLLNLSFAVNYAVSGLEVWSYHLVNLLIHGAAAVILYLLVRLTLASQRPERAALVAVGAALLWVVHPLQTESVTYVVQRAESLMGLGVLGALYAFARGLHSSRPGRWWIAATLVSWLAVATKEVAVLIPVLALAYDRTFVAGSLGAALRARAGVYAALLTAWLPLAGWVLGTGGNRGDTMGWGVSLAWTDYLATQPEAWLRYLQRTVWPAPLIFDYGPPTPVPWRVAVLQALPLAGLVGAVMMAWIRRSGVGFLGVAFIGLLAPTTLVPSVVQAIVEHRMYLPLAAVLIALVAGLAVRLPPRSLLAGIGVLALGGIALTNQRNAVYANEEALWRDTVAKRPGNARAHNNLGRVVQQAGRDAEAVGHYAEAVRRDPRNAQAHFNLGLARFRLGEVEAALPGFDAAVALIPEFALAHLNRGLALIRLGRADEARAALEQAVRYPPPSAEAHFHLGVLYAEAGRLDEALARYSEALALRPGWAQAWSNRGLVRLRANDVAGADADLQQARALAPGVAEFAYHQGLVAAAQGRLTEAIAAYEEAVRLAPDFFAARLNLGIALGQSGAFERSVAELQALTMAHPESVEAFANLGTAMLSARRPDEALAAYERALALRPQDPQQHYNVGYALLLVNRWTEARARFEEALRLQPEFAPAATMLRNLRGGR